MNTDTKRARGPNYTSEEVTLLINILAEHKGTIENKKTDAVTCKDKEKAWVEVTKHFNSSNNIPRTMESLKKVYENKKKEVRKKSANVRMVQNTTGLGVGRSIPTINESDTLLLSIMNTKTVDGIPCRYGGDAIPSTSACSQATISKGQLDTSTIDQPENADDSNNDEELQNTENEELDCENFRSSHLQTPLNNNVRTRINNTSTSQSWTARRRPIASVSASELSKEYSALAKLKLECSRMELEKLQQEKKNQEIESRLRQEILKIELKSKEIDLKMKEFQLAKALEK